MRLLSLILLAWWCASCRSGVDGPSKPAVHRGPDPFGPEGRWLFEAEFEGHRHEFAVADAYLRAHSTWRADRDPLPISRAAVTRAATEQAHRLAPEVVSWGLEDVTLRWVFDECWYFEVTLSDCDRPVAGRIPQDRMIKIPVLLNGVAVHPYRSR